MQAARAGADVWRYPIRNPFVAPPTSPRAPSPRREEPPRKLPPPLPKSCTKLLKRFAGRMHDAKSKGRGRAYVDGRFPAVAAVLRRHGCAPPQKGEEAARLAPEQGRERAAAFALLLRWCAALLADERALAEEVRGCPRVRAPWWLRAACL